MPSAPRCAAKAGLYADLVTSRAGPSSCSSSTLPGWPGPSSLYRRCQDGGHGHFKNVSAPMAAGFIGDRGANGFQTSRPLSAKQAGHSDRALIQRCEEVVSRVEPPYQRQRHDSDRVEASILKYALALRRI